MNKKYKIAILLIIITMFFNTQNAINHTVDREIVKKNQNIEEWPWWTIV